MESMVLTIARAQIKRGDAAPTATVLIAALDRLQAERERIEQLFAGGPDTPCRTTWRPEPSTPDCSAASIECVEVPMSDLRAVLDGAS